jgi:hypothetical protein
MSAGLVRASVFALREESSSGTLIAPSATTQFVPVRPGAAMAYEVEELENEELLNDIGAAKTFKGKESVSGEHAAYLKHSGVEGQEPQLGIMYESIMGDKTVNATEYNTVASSTTTVVKVDTGEGAQFYKGQALLIKDGTNGYSIRNVSSISSDDLTINFSLANAPGSGVNLGKAITYKPAATGHPTYSAWYYGGNGFFTQAAAGCTTSEVSMEFPANGFAEVTFSYEGTKYYFNPIIISSSNKYLDITDDTGTIAVAVAEGQYRNPIELARAIESAWDAATTETVSVSFSNSTGKFTLSSGSSVLSLLWNSGANAANSIGTTIGFSVAANDTGSTSYVADNAISYAAVYTPSYDSVDAIIVKDCELLIGSQTDNTCVCANSVSITISKEVEDVDCICEETGTQEKIAVGRTVEMQVSAVMSKHEARFFDNLLNNTTISTMLNAGPKSAGNWVAGKCVNIYLQNAVVSSFSTEGDSYIVANMTIRGFVSSSDKDCFINFV